MSTNIDAMPAGRELDALVAEQVLGKKVELYRLCPVPYHRFKDTEQGIPYYSTDIAAAWEVVEKVQRINGRFRVDIVGPCQGSDEYSVGFLPMLSGYGTAPLAICRAALKAVGA